MNRASNTMMYYMQRASIIGFYRCGATPGQIAEVAGTTEQTVLNIIFEHINNNNETPSHNFRLRDHRYKPQG